VLLRVNRSPTSLGAREQRRQDKGCLLVGLGDMLTCFTEWLVGESGKRLWGFSRRLGSLGGCGLELAHRGSTLWPQPRQNHAQPEYCEQQECVEKPVVSHVVPLPSRWRGGISPFFPARQLSVPYRDTTDHHLQRLLKAWVQHDNHGRPHMALEPGIPQPPPPLPTPLQAYRHRLSEHLRVVVHPILGGLHHEYRLGNRQRDNMFADHSRVGPTLITLVPCDSISTIN
jgi:hypothetical protein